MGLLTHRTRGRYGEDQNKKTVGSALKGQVNGDRYSGGAATLLREEHRSGFLRDNDNRTADRGYATGRDCFNTGHYRYLARTDLRNGFQIKAVLMHEHVTPSYGTWYKVEDPAAHGSRVELINDRRTYICTIAQRVEDL